ncbi:sialyltransferase family domain containing protein [Musa troglodytarum]|nr:sialyltransferase family domain containing protein [Musa troglodytarum]
MCGRLESAYAAGGRSRIISIWRSMRYAGSRPGLLARLRFPARAEHPDRVRLFQEFRWRLSDWFLDSRGLQPEVMSELIERIKRPIDRHYGHPHTGRPYATCAVVSNSGVLLKSAHGRLIDGHDLVIRLHNARTVGYQQHVGSKATVSFINSSILHSCAVRLGCYCNPYGHFAPIAVMLALGICKRVNVFGFGRSVDANHHNHTNQTAELNVHDHAAEHDFYRDLVERPQAIPYLRVTKIEVPPVVFYH